jgi:hypothetical protein
MAEIDPKTILSFTDNPTDSKQKGTQTLTPPDIEENENIDPLPKLTSLLSIIRQQSLRRRISVFRIETILKVQKIDRLQEKL